MNPLISPSSSIYSPLNQLNTHCNRLVSSLQDGRASHKERVLFEQTLWNEVKKVRVLNDSSIFNYLIGFYHSILYRASSSAGLSQNDLFQYHVLIRLGDLNRYMERNDLAEYYYCNARNLYPYFGHAYNQLGLLTKPTSYYKCCYYYARAARSSDKPLSSIAESNLRTAISKFNCLILENVLNGESSIEVSDDEVADCKLPDTAFEWFYLIVVAIHADNIQPIAKSFLMFMNENFSTQKASIKSDTVQTTSILCDLDSYVLLASLDILLDWLRLGSQGKTFCSSISSNLRQVCSGLPNIISLCKEDCDYLNLSGSTYSSGKTIVNTNSSDVSMSSSSLLVDNSSSGVLDSSRSSDNPTSGPALPHDYVLRGFEPLKEVHQELSFGKSLNLRNEVESIPLCSTSDNQVYIETEQLLQIALRLKFKLDALGPMWKKQTRNIALQSILNNIDKN